MAQADLFTFAWPWFLATAIAMARPLGLLAVTPLLARAQLTGLLRGAVAASLALPAIPFVVHQVQGGTFTGLGLLLLTLKEAVIGAGIGFLLGAPFWAFQFAGDLIDQQRGATSGRLSDPAGGDDVSVTGTLLLVTGITLFVATGGLQTLVALLYASWGVWPPLASMPAPTPEFPVRVLRLLGDVTRQGLLLGAPIVLSMLLADVAMTLISRFAPQFRIEDTAATVRNLTFCITLPIYCAVLLATMGHDLIVPQGFLADLARSLR